LRNAPYPYEDVKYATRAKIYLDEVMGVKFKTPVVVEPYKFTWFDVEFPDPRPYEVIFRNKACLICGSDLHSYKGLHPFAPIPTCTGHEVAAEVFEVGSKVSTLQVGDRVYVAGTGASPLPCGQCFYCVRGASQCCMNPHKSISFKIDGKVVSRFPSGFGEYSINHEARAYKIPDNVSFYEAATTTDVSYVIGVVIRSGGGIGKTAVVIGAGPIGLRTLEVAKAAGVSPIFVSDPLGYRLAKAKELSADAVINPMEEDPVERVKELTDGTGVDIVYDTAGNLNATQQGLNMLNTSIGGAGRLYLMGLYEAPHNNLTFNISDLMYKAGAISTEWGQGGGRGIIQTALNMMSQGKLHILKWITHKIPEKRARHRHRDCSLALKASQLNLHAHDATQ
jgi:threonine dehydrogenase-like Zn-dependent dehydrogenase